MMMLIFCTCFIDRPSRDPFKFDKPKILFSKFRCKGLPNKLTIWFLLVRFFSLFVFVKKKIHQKHSYFFYNFFSKWGWIILLFFAYCFWVVGWCQKDIFQWYKNLAPYFCIGPRYHNNICFLSSFAYRFWVVGWCQKYMFQWYKK